MIKASWKILTDAEKASGRFHQVEAFLYDPPIDSTDGKNHIAASCSGPHTMGLVGLHIAHKTASFPQWIWVTFEQVDNAPDRGATAITPSSFSNPQCPNCPPNMQPACPNQLSPTLCDWQPNIQHIDPKLKVPTQVERDTPLSSDGPTIPINQDVQNRFKNVNPQSVWQFYELVDAQWALTPCGSLAPCKPGDTPSPCVFGNFSCKAAQPLPAFLANTTMETYFQSKAATASRGTCMGCHAQATKAISFTQQADFSFELEQAHTPKVQSPFKSLVKKGAN